LKRADDLEKLRKEKEADKPKKSPHEQAVDQYASYVATQMHLIPKDNWFKFTLENMNMIQSYITRQSSRGSGTDAQPAIMGPSFPNDYSLNQNVNYQMQQSGYGHRAQTPSLMNSHSSYLSSAFNAQPSQSASLPQSFMTPGMPSLHSAQTITSLSPSSFLNPISPSLQQTSGQHHSLGANPGNPMASTSVTSLSKQSSSTAEVTATDTSQTDVMSFQEQLFA
jgi:hypothetical protein